jgi:hemerythrin-like domain-containing protein
MPDVENGTDDQVAAHVKVLKELVEHHADEEETSMFPKARKVLDRDELRELGERLKARKKELGG